MLLTWAALMHRNFEVLKAPIFWAALGCYRPVGAWRSCLGLVRVDASLKASLALFIAGDFGFFTLIESRGGPGR